ncbi:MAG: ATP-binding cassette domain-containing protein, partial [Rhizobiaceae bacterium]|nr:ATP-binding cassette domain-containing protein [Rhizobiaceae bacterium]
DSAACLGIVLEFYGHVHSALDLRRLCAVGRDGASVAQIQRGTEALGHKCRIVKKGIESLRKATMPIILHWDLRHFVVLEGMSKDRVWINDPAVGRRKLTRAEFERHFTGICLEITVDAEAEAKEKGPSWSALKALAPAGTQHIKTALSVGIAGSFLVFIVDLVFGGIPRAFFDYIVGYQISSWGYALGLVGLPILLIRSALRHLQSLRLESQTQDLSLHMKRAFLDRLYARPTVFFDTHFAGELFGRLRDLDQSLRVSLKALHTIMPQTVTILLSIGTLVFFAPLMAVMLVVPRIALLGWLFLLTTRTRELELRLRDEMARNQALQAQRAGGFLRFFSTGLQDHLLATCLPLIGRWQAAKAAKERHFIAYNSAQRSFETISLPLSSFVGAYLMMDAQLTYGGFMLASALAVILSTQMSELFDTIQKLRGLQPIVRRVAEVVEEAELEEHLESQEFPVMQSDSMELDSSVHIFLNRVGFGYNSIDADLYADLSFAIKRHEFVCILGQSGVGKSTLLDLIAGLRRPIGGGVYFNGQLLKGPAPCGFVVADDELMVGTLASFVASGKEADPERLTDVLREVELWDRLGFFVHADGSEKLEKQGLSRGEVQRLMLAQALYRNQECLLFDEAFNHLSLEQSMRILTRLRQKGMTIVMATHRPEIQQLCDRFVILKPQVGGPIQVSTMPNPAANTNALTDGTR